MKNVLMIVLVATCLTSTAWSQARSVLPKASPAWKKISESTVFFYGNSESWTVFRVDSLELDQVKLRILNSSLVLEKLLVFYSSGEVRTFSIQSRINPLMEVGPFLLDSGRLITSVSFRYKTGVDETYDRGLIELYGRRTTNHDDRVGIYKRTPD